MNALVVDDDPIARHWLAHVLRPHVHQVVFAEDGSQAWSLLTGGLRPAVCIVDVLMPKMGGMELLDLVRGERCTDDLPFILVSAAAERGDVDQAAAKRASAYLLKPFLAAQARCVMAAVTRDCRMARAEHVLQTLRRLDADVQQLEQLLGAFELDILAHDRAGASQALAQQRATSERLGLYRCTQLLASAAQLPSLDPARLRLIRECAALVRDQRAELGVMFTRDDIAGPAVLVSNA